MPKWVLEYPRATGTDVYARNKTTPSVYSLEQKRTAYRAVIN